MKKLIIPIVIIIIIVTAILVINKRKKYDSYKQEIQTTKVERGNIEVKVLATGTIQPYTRVEVRPPISGRIDKVEVDEGDKIKKGDILVWLSSEDRIALLDAANSAIARAKRSGDTMTIKEAELSLEIADKAYKPVFITTSISGEVIKRECEPGQNVSSQNILFAISDKLVAKVEIDETDIGKIKQGQSASITLDAFPDEQIIGEVTKISSESKIVSNVTIYDVMVTPIKVPTNWKSGMTANVNFLIDSKQDVLIIPRNTVRRQRNRNFITVTSDRNDSGKGKQETMEIKTGISDGQMVEVIKGLKEGDEIILQTKGETTRTQGGPPMGTRMGRMMRR